MGFGEYIKRVAATLLVAALAVALWNTRSILTLAFAAVVVAIAIARPMRFLRTRGMKRGPAAGLAIAFSFAVLTSLSLWIVPTLVKGVADIARDLPAAAESAKNAYIELRGSSPSLLQALPEIPAENAERTIDAESVRGLFHWLVKSGMAIAPDLLGGLGLLASVLVNLGLVLGIGIFFLLEPSAYVVALLYVIPKNKHARAKEVLATLRDTLDKWLSAQLFSVTVIALLVWIILGVILGMPNALVVALFAGFATFIPNIGAVLPIIPIMIFTLAYADPAKLLLYIPVYLAIQFTESNIITPQVVKAQLNIPAGYLLLFQLLITMALGALGLVLAVPILACLIVFIRETYAYDVLRLRNLKPRVD